MNKLLGKYKNKIRKYKDKPGSAIALTMFLLAGMLMVALSGAYIITVGIKAAGVQSQSTKAYFAAESGSERLLWELRKNGWHWAATSSSVAVFSSTLPTGANYKVYYTYFNPIIFPSIGEFSNTKRSVEIRM
jgi:hypothetical protein